ncbi:Bacterial type II secretion system protein F domain protein [Paenibacillus konkukensis]|uniref:Bacterial type II secretion system protein F domain protein n=1 Tax=Paenibacillus konkukensis TaxID=2020716 RepID=A0ABY4RIE3_9BACL|nr:type II secretion system F family protein [Paenibacillus konkukensis]UQZ81626.1 Bacterial type II secretion system protein F domain protein [Paenibacillus konkukensis]
MIYIVAVIAVAGGGWLMLPLLRSRSGPGAAGRLKRFRLPLRLSQEPEATAPHATGLTNYSEYRLSVNERVLSVVIGMAGAGLVGFIFYKSAAATAILACAGLYCPVLWRKEMIRRRKLQLQLQFKQALSSLSSALGAGKSVESAFQEALSDLRLLYPDAQAFIIKELETVNRRIENGETIEAALKDWSARAQVEDIQQFTDVFITCKRSGGNLVHVIRRTASIIQEKLDIEQDIQVMMAQKRFESKVLSFAPLIVVAVLNFSSPDYMEPLYQGAGYLIMTVALLILIGCFAITRWIMNVKV